MWWSYRGVRASVIVRVVMKAGERRAQGKGQAYDETW